MDAASIYYARLDMAETGLRDAKRQNKIMAECLEQYRLEALRVQLALTRERKITDELRAEILVLRGREGKRRAVA